jgi:hypothetical protein
VCRDYEPLSQNAEMAGEVTRLRFEKIYPAAPWKNAGRCGRAFTTVSKQRAFNLVIVHKRSTVSDTLESSTARAILKKEKVRLISVTEPMVGPNTPENFLMEHLIVGMADFTAATCPAKS